MAGPAIWFASPGDPATLTGGYIYNARVRQGLIAAGWTVHSIRLPDRFPHPEFDDHETAGEPLAAIPPDGVVVIDGLALGAMAPKTLHPVRAKIIALIHHPLADESGLDEEQIAVFAHSEQRALECADGIIVTSTHTQAALVERYNVPAEKISVVCPGVDRPATKSRPDMPPVILSVGTLAIRKGHDVLIAALGEISDLAWTATIIGSTDRDPKTTHLLHKLRTQFRLENRVEFAGEQDATALEESYSRATIFALATRHEGYGMVFSEAMVHGLPIVSCAAGAVPDTVAGDAGILVPPDSAAQFAGALRRLLTNTTIRQEYARGAFTAGAALPTWQETAQLFGKILLEQFIQ